jgi:cobalt-zinc-cadmium efflux system outer membrane protein
VTHSVTHRVTHRAIRSLTMAIVTCVLPRAVSAQRRISLDDALAAARAAGPALRVARADSAAGAARLLSASAFPNPSLTLGYSKSPPPYHIEIEQPFEFPWLRRSRMAAARLHAEAAAIGTDIASARLRYDVEAAYASASVASAIASLSAQNARDADELVRIAVARRDAGDAADLDVDLARVFDAGQHRTASVDSLAAVVATLELQSAMGIAGTAVEVVPSDTFIATPIGTTRATAAATPSLALQQADLESQAAAAALSTARRSSRFSEIAIRAGVETGDSEQRGLLPTLGVSLPIPLFNRNRGAIAEARADRDRATALLEQARLEQALGLAVAENQHRTQQVILAQDRAGLEDARRVAARAQTAYREGEYPLASVIEAQRNARDALRQYYEDMGTLWLSQAAFTLARTTGMRPVPENR